MIKNYFFVALRNFWRHKTFSTINILGLAIGISASLVIFLLVYYDLSFDKFEKNKDHIYRVVAKNTLPGNDRPGYSGSVPIPMGPAIEKEITGTDLVVPFHTWYHPKVSTLRDQKDVIVADARYFELLDYTWLAGSEKTALQQPYQTVLTEKNARLYFPNIPYTNILGKTLAINDTILTTVTGIVKDLPGNTDFSFGTFVSNATWETARLKPENWDHWDGVHSSDQLFIRLAPGVTPASLIPRLTALRLKHEPGDRPPGFKTEIQLETLSELHFGEHYDGFDGARMAHKPTLYGLITVAAILLLLACINFINLTTARASQRVKEIGIRKAMGSGRSQLRLQFLSETLLLTTIAAGLSIIIAPFLFKVFADFIPDDFHYSLAQPGIILFLTALIVTVTLLSGFYPAIVMSGFDPIIALKNQASAGMTTTRSAWFRKTLTVSQFVIAQVFIIGTILVGKQISYALNMDMGFRKNAVLTFETNWRSSATKRNTLVTQLRTIPGIEKISVSAEPPSSDRMQGILVHHNNGKKDLQIMVQIKGGDSNYFSLYNLHLLAGSVPSQSDTSSDIVINQTLAGIIGFQNPYDALGKKLGGADGHTIVGVMADFHTKSIHTPINPLLLSNDTNGNTINVALMPGSPWPSIIAQIEKVYKPLYPDEAFSYSFVDETIAKFYTTEKNTARLLAWATGLTIFISCLGLLGLVIYITNQRTKEIGVRKVIGASVTQIVALLSKDFMTLIGVAVAIAIPLAWWGSHQWLENFAYKTNLSWWIFASGAAILIVAALTVLCIRTYKAAGANPVDSLRTE